MGQTQHISVPYLACSHQFMTAGVGHCSYDTSHGQRWACLPTWRWCGGVTLVPILELPPQEHSRHTWASAEVRVNDCWCFLTDYLGGEEAWRRTQIPCSIMSLSSYWLTLPTESRGSDLVTTPPLWAHAVTTLLRNNDICMRNTYSKYL